MSSRLTRAVGLGVAVALAAAGLLVPAAQAAGATSDPVFHRAVASAPGAARAGSARARGSALDRVPPAESAGKVATTSKVQVVQNLQGLVGTATSAVPTTSLAVGPKQVLEFSTAGARVLNKTTGKVVGTTTNLKKFFGIADAGVTVSQPTAAFDPLGRRFIIAAVTDDTGPSGLVVRVSKKATINKKQSSWNDPFGYADSNNVVESDPRIGTSGDKVVVTAKASDSGDASVKNSILVVSKKKLYAAKTNGPNAWLAEVNATYDGQTPAINVSSGNSAFVAVPYTTDFTVYTLTGSAKTSAPAFSKSVMYPSVALVDAPDVPQVGGDTITLPRAIDSASVSWRQGMLWAGLTVGCTPSGDTSTRACLRLYGVKTGSGVSLAQQLTRSKSGTNWFAPAVGIDGKKAVHVGFSTISATGASKVGSAVAVRKSKGGWTAVRTISSGSAPFDNGTASTTTPWSEAGAAAVDPTSPWDVWVSAVSSTSAITPPAANWTSTLARTTLAKNAASIRANSTRVSRGARVTFTGKLSRPQSKDVIMGLPIVLQSKAKGSKKWLTVSSETTSKKGQRRWTFKVTKTAQYRIIGKAVNQGGRHIAKVVSRSLRVTVR